MNEIKITIPKDIFVETDNGVIVVNGTFSFTTGVRIFDESPKEIIMAIDHAIFTVSTKQRTGAN